jgi:integral membrane protein (TIGR01906 family)
MKRNIFLNKKMRINKDKLMLILFCVFITIFFLLLSYKVALGTTELTENQEQTVSYLVDDTKLSLNYTANENSHLEDVQKVMNGLDYLFYFSLLVVTLIITIYQKKRRDIIKKLFLYGGISSLSVSIFVLLFAIFGFNSMFTIFHKIFFPQGNWTFPMESLLIQTFPLQFFITISLKIMVIAIIIAAAMVFVGRRMK